jgi:hypothetical protein
MGNAGHVTRLHKAGVDTISQHRRYFTDRAANYSNPVGHGFQDDQRQAFVIRRQYKNIGPSHQAGDLLLVGPTGEINQLFNAQLLCLYPVGFDVAAASQNHLSSRGINAWERQRLQ